MQRKDRAPNEGMGKRMRKPKRREFYRMGPDLRAGGVPGYCIENKMTLTEGRRVLMAPIGQRGFPDYPEPPAAQERVQGGRLEGDHVQGRKPCLMMVAG